MNNIGPSRKWAAAAVTSLSFVTVTACADESEWRIARKESTLDGTVLSASRDFREATNPTQINASITCELKSMRLKVVLTSLKATETDGRFDSSPLIADVQDEVPVPKGRVARSGWSGSQEQWPLGHVFELMDYNNVIEFEVAEESASRWLVEDEDGFWQWAGALIPNPGGVDQALLVDAARSAIAIQAGLRSLSSLSTETGLAETAIIVGAEINAYAIEGGNVGRLAPGAYLRRSLPLTVELFNDGGAFEITIPAGEKSIDEVLSACEGTKWWRESEQGRGVAAATLQDSARTPSSVMPDSLGLGNTGLDFPGSGECSSDMPHQDVIAQVSVAGTTYGVCVELGEPSDADSLDPSPSVLRVFAYRKDLAGAVVIKTASPDDPFFFSVGSWEEEVGQSARKRWLWFEDKGVVHVFERCDGGRLCTLGPRYVQITGGQRLVDGHCTSSDVSCDPESVDRVADETDVTVSKFESRLPDFVRVRSMPEAVAALLH